jgi:hypothetical protein
MTFNPSQIEIPVPYGSPMKNRHIYYTLSCGRSRPLFELNSCKILSLWLATQVQWDHSCSVLGAFWAWSAEILVFQWCPRRFLRIINQYPSVYKSNLLHADIFWVFFFNLEYILSIPQKWSAILLKSRTSAVYFSKSTGSSNLAASFPVHCFPSRLHVDNFRVLFIKSKNTFLKLVMYR